MYIHLLASNPPEMGRRLPEAKSGTEVTTRKIALTPREEKDKSFFRSFPLRGCR